MRGDLLIRTTRPSLRRFNPRPALSCGATAAGPGRGDLVIVSIRAPHFHAGRHAGYAHCFTFSMFQSAPRTFMRGDICPQAGCARDRVSIRAPHFHAGRPFSYCIDPKLVVFQSAPRTFMRGDGKSPEEKPKEEEVSIRAPHFHAGRRYTSG